MSNEDNKLAVTYQDVEITYNENKSQFEFILRGRERYAVSLRAAKDAIDTPPDPKKEGPAFKRAECYLEDYGGNHVVTVTSAIQSGYYSSYFRYRSPKERGTNQASGKSLYPVTEDSTKKFAEVKALREQAQELGIKARNIIATIQTLAQREEANKKAAEAAAKE